MTSQTISARGVEGTPNPVANLFLQAPSLLVPLLILTLPLEFTQKFTPLSVVQLSRLVMAVCLVTLFVQKAFGLREVRLPPMRLWIPVVSFIAYAALSAALSRSLPGLKTVAAMVVYSFVALAMYNWCATVWDQDRFWTWLAISVIAVSIVGLIEAVTGTLIWNAPNSGVRWVNSTFKDPNTYARFLTFGAVASVVLASRPRANARAVLITALMLAAAALPFTFSRQGWVLGALVLLLAVVMAVERRRALGLVALAFIAFAAVALLDPQVRDRWSVLGEILTTAPPRVYSGALAFVNLLPLDTVRRYLVAAGFQMFYDHPIFGVGFGNFPSSMLGAYSGFIAGNSKTIDSHTSFVTIIAELGLVGLALAAWWAFEFVRSSVSSFRSQVRRPYVTAALLALLLILLVSQLEGRFLEEPYLWLFLGAALGAQRIDESSAARRSAARIALVHDIAGVAKIQAQLLRGAGHEVDMIALPEVGAAWRWPAKALAIPVRLVLYAPAISRLRTKRYDVIHIHWLSQGIVGLLSGRQFFAQAHGSDLHVNLGNPLLLRVTRSVLEGAKAVFYVTPNLPAYVPAYESKLRYLPNPILVGETAEAPPASVRSVLIFTRLAEVKGVDKIFPAVDRLRDSVEVTAIESGPLSIEYVQRYTGSVRFVLPVPHDEVRAFLGQFDVVIGQMNQGSLGLSELEAMAVGRPVITGIDWSLYPEDPPPVIAAGNADEIVEAVERLRGDAAELARLSREGRDWVERNHGYARHLQLLESAYFGGDVDMVPTPMTR
ncbi:MAG TPA: O-antigen ligase family protein [Candidatus Micrarchaeaceae archaeon]|nr:O-antigen ligase family protein [Candidatus Micrarchaeaceae archaeon]